MSLILEIDLLTLSIGVGLKLPLPLTLIVVRYVMDRVVEDCLFFLHYIQKFESSDCSMRYDVSFCDLLCVVL